MLLQTPFPLLRTLGSLCSSWQTSHPLRFSSKIATTVKFSPRCLLSTQPRPGKASPSLLLRVCSQVLFSVPSPCFPGDLTHSYAFS